MTARSAETHFTLRPFDNTRDIRFFFESTGHAEALSRMSYLITDKTMGMGMLTGEVGCGKTLTRTVLANRFSPAEYILVSIENSLLSFDGLLLEIISQIRKERIQSADLPDRYSKMAEYKRLLLTEGAQKDRHLVILIDEAQQLSSETIEALKGLTNISTERANLVTILLIGQSELRDRVKARPQIDQRVSLRFHLNPITPSESVHYINHRMKVAGLKGPMPFEREAIKAIAKHAGGIPRNINRLCKLSLDYAQSRGLEHVTVDLVELVTSDLSEQTNYQVSDVSLG